MNEWLLPLDRTDKGFNVLACTQAVGWSKKPEFVCVENTGIRNEVAILDSRG